MAHRLGRFARGLKKLWRQNERYRYLDFDCIHKLAISLTGRLLRCKFDNYLVKIERLTSLSGADF